MQFFTLIKTLQSYLIIYKNFHTFKAHEIGTRGMSHSLANVYSIPTDRHKSIATSRRQSRAVSPHLTPLTPVSRSRSLGQVRRNI